MLKTFSVMVGLTLSLPLSLPPLGGRKGKYQRVTNREERERAYQVVNLPVNPRAPLMPSVPLHVSHCLKTLWCALEEFKEVEAKPKAFMLNCWGRKGKRRKLFSYKDLRDFSAEVHLQPLPFITVSLYFIDLHFMLITSLTREYLTKAEGESENSCSPNIHHAEKKEVGKKPPLHPQLKIRFIFPPSRIKHSGLPKHWTLWGQTLPHLD